MNRKGFTLLELVVAIGIMLILVAAATPMLLSHLKDAKVSGINENFINVKSAFDSYFTKNGGIVNDSDGDNDYLDEMINEGWLTNDPSRNDLTWTVESYTSGGKTSFYIKVANATADGYNYIQPLVSKLDEAIDGVDNSSEGRFQYSDTGSAFTGYYLLYAEAGMSQWHP